MILPPLSLDLTAPDFFLWVCLKFFFFFFFFYQTEHKVNIRETIQNIPRDVYQNVMLHNAVKELEKARSFVTSRGEYLTDVIFKTISGLK